MVVFWLVHEDKIEVTTGLKHIEQIWRAWEAAERESYVNDEVAEILHNIVWMTHQWPRMVCLELLQTDFQEVPAELKRELMQTARGPQTTNATEDAICEPRKKCNMHMTKRLARHMRWCCCVESGHLVDSDRRPTPSTPTPFKASVSLKLGQDFSHGE